MYILIKFLVYVILNTDEENFIKKGTLKYFHAWVLPINWVSPNYVLGDFLFILKL